MKNILTHSFLALVIASSATIPLHARDDHKKYDSLAYYGTHLLTGSASLVSAALITLWSCALGAYLEKEGAGAACLLPILVGAGTGLTITYKTPQWTNNYFFEEKPVRLTKQNVITFVTRLLLLPTMPLLGFNVWISEYLGNNIVTEDEVA